MAGNHNRRNNGNSSLTEPVRRHRERRDRWHREGGERSLARNLGLVGALGWLIVVPTLIGISAGRWLDRAYGSGVFWTLGLLLVGLCLGCWLAWRRIQEE